MDGSMKLPEDATIAEDKLTHYLLLPQARGDKSAFLTKAGYTLKNADQLMKDLSTQILTLDAEHLESNKFGQYFELRGTLTGPNGQRLPVRTIWMTEHLSHITKFITLVPDKRRT
jgi:hypothetical protein